jgi:hypothetical protein
MAWEIRMADTQPLLAPDIIEQQQRLQMRQALAQNLMDKGTNADYSTRTAGGVAIQNSPINGVANMLSAYLGGRAMNATNKEGAELARSRQQAMSEALKTGLGQLESDPAGAIALLAANPDTAKFAAALAPDRFRPEPKITAQQQRDFDLRERQFDQQKSMSEREYAQRERDIAARRAEAAANEAARREQLETGRIPAGYRKTADGLEPIPGGPADAKAQAAANLKASGATDVDLAIGTLRDAYDRLEKGGGITSTGKGNLDNAGAWIASSGLGQTAGKMFGTNNQSARNDIAMTRPALLAALMKATGMSAKQMDSNAELKLWLATATDPTLDVESNRRALANIEKKYLGPRTTLSDAGKPAPTKYAVGQVIEQGGKKYRVIGGDLNDPDVELVP